MTWLGGTPTARATGPAAPDRAAARSVTRQSIGPGERACCCTAPAVVRAVVTCATPVVHSVDLLLCGHHYRHSLAELLRRGAMVFDRDGHLLAPDADPLESEAWRTPDRDRFPVASA